MLLVRVLFGSFDILEPEDSNVATGTLGWDLHKAEGARLVSYTGLAILVGKLIRGRL